MPKERFTTPTSNPTFPPTLEDCDQNPSTCPFVQGTQVGDKIYDATCIKPITGSIEAIVDGWGEPIIIELGDLEKVMCGKCHYIKGVRRTQ